MSNWFDSLCYLPNLNTVVLSDQWIAQNYNNLYFGLFTRDQVRFNAVYEELFIVLSHEAGHQFGYTNPVGSTVGCGGSLCHAPYGSGSIMSYDHQSGLSVRYNVTEDDIRYIPNATWNNSSMDRYAAFNSGEPASIDRWGVWIDHQFQVSGQTFPGRLNGGNFGLLDQISGMGWVSGRPSENIALASTATWGGMDNFLGVNLNPASLGALLRADANLRYTVGENTRVTLQVGNFDAHLSLVGWTHFDTWGPYRYTMDCGTVGCSGEEATMQWYANDTGDPTGWVGGILNDGVRMYVGSFVAERD